MKQTLARNNIEACDTWTVGEEIRIQEDIDCDDEIDDFVIV